MLARAYTFMVQEGLASRDTYVGDLLDMDWPVLDIVPALMDWLAAGIH